MRRALRGAWYEPGKQGSAWLSTFLQGSGTQDPQVSAWSDPIFQWALLCWDGSLHGVLQRAWARQIGIIYREAKPWGHVAGPCGAMLLAIRDLGW
eukprot:9054812-Pyramimonas_sp.AAC.1